jgi:hypothetical protein
MTEKFNKSVPFKNSGSFIDYDSGEIDGTTTEELVELADEVRQLLVLPKVESYIKLNDNDKWIYLQANSWTPISVKTTSFTVKTKEAIGKIYWQGWLL